MAHPDTEQPPTADTGVLVLPAELTIYAVGELHPAWCRWAEGGGATVDGAAVEQLDAAGLQLLLSLSHSVRSRGERLHLSTASEALRNGCAALGLAPWLTEHLEGAAA